MADQSIKEKYYSLLLHYINRQEELPLAKAYELGRALMIADLGVEDIATIHESAMRRLGNEFPEMTLKQTSSIVFTPLREMLMSFSMLFQEQKERVLAEEALRESEKNYQSLYDNAPDMYFTVSPDGIVKSVNQFGADCLGYSKEELTGKSVWTIVHKDDLESVQKQVVEIFNNKLQQSELDFRKIRKDGAILWVHERTNLVLDENDNPIELWIVCRDVTDRKLLEAQLQQSQKIEALGTLTGGIAHEFNNVLGIIIGNTELALDDVPEWNPAHFNLDEIKTASLRAKDVVRQLLSYIRKIDYKRKPMKIIPVVKDSIKFLRASMPSTIEIQNNIEATADTILADPTQIHQIMINLGTNASHAMEKTGGVLNIGIQNVALDEDIPYIDPDLNPGSYVKVTLRDTGQGIAPEIIDRIFDPYFTTKEVDKGAGLGLAVVHGIIKSYGGAITVDSELGKGTTFTAYFPIIEEEAVIRSKSIEEQPAGNERILFVDDEKSIVRMGTQRLERLGYQVESTTSSLKALDLFRSKPDQFDLVITDLTMPKMTGDKLVKEILNIRPEMPIIICTGFNERMDGEKASAIGAAGFLAKPHEKSELAITVRKVLGGKGR